VPPAATFALGVSRGALVVSVDPAGPSAGVLQRGDVIVEVEGTEVADPAQAVAALHRTRGPVVLRIVRGEEVRYVAVRGWRQG
jgi:S1-C subfamily serine protease